MSAAQDRFFAMVAELKAKRLPTVQTEWSQISEGYRKLICRQAGVSKTDLTEMSEEDRMRCFFANLKIQELAQHAGRVLGMATLRKTDRAARVKSQG